MYLLRIVIQWAIIVTPHLNLVSPSGSTFVTSVEPWILQLETTNEGGLFMKRAGASPAVAHL